MYPDKYVLGCLSDWKYRGLRLKENYGGGNTMWRDTAWI